MKQLLIILALLSQDLSSTAQTDNKIVIGYVDSVQSMILGEQRKIWVYVPNSEPGDLYAVQRYPVVYLLDGDAHFFSVVGMIQQLSGVNGNMITPEMIVIGIPNTDRTRDLTPTHVDADPPYMDSAFSKPSGGGEKFLAFIEKELMPHIDSVYPTQSYKMLIGHSFGGLTVMNSFVNHTNLFNSYICIDPSMWWDHQKLLAATQKKLAENKFGNSSLFLGIANTMDDGMNIKSVRRDTAGSSRHIRSILTLNDYFLANKQNGLKYSSKYYADDSHGSVPLITEYDAFRFIFDFYPLKFTAADYLDSTTKMVNKMEAHFAKVSKVMGYKITPPENQVNGNGYNALASKHFKKAEGFFRLNVANYPQSANVYDSLGDYYVAVGDSGNAITQFKKALSIKENPDTQKKLEELLKKNKYCKMEHPENNPSAEGIMQIGTGFWASKILLTAVHFQLFTKLAGGKKLSASAIKELLQLQCNDRHVYDFLDTLSYFGFLNREGLLETASYSNSINADTFLDKMKASYIGGILEMMNDRLYRFWGNLEDALQTGGPQNETKDGRNLFDELYKEPNHLYQFVQAMSGIQMGNFLAFAQKFNFSKYNTLTDVGGSSGLLSVLVAKYQSHMNCVSLDLPPVEPIANYTIHQFGMEERVKAVSEDFFVAPFPGADIVVMGNVLHDWDEEHKLILMKKAIDAIPEGGAFVAIESIIDDDRKHNVFGMMMSLNMLIESGNGFDYSFADFNKWAAITGFKSTEILPLAGPSSAAIAYK